MFRKYGLLGIGMIVFVGANFFLKIQPLANLYFPIVWYGYILVIDALIYKLRGNSLITNRFSQFLGRKKLHKRHKITKKFLHAMMAFGVICFIAPVLLPKFAYPLVWFSFFFILDPINYIHRQPSIVGHLKDRKLATPLSLLFAGIILGFLWEFWNYWAIPKWTYDIPFVGFFKIFEMPVLGYIGYFPFAFELYAMYWFARSLFARKEHLLE